MFFGTPHAGSAADEKKRVWLLKKMAKAAGTEVPPKLEAALRQHSDEVVDLADDFLKTDLCTNERIKVYSYYEEHSTPKLGEKASTISIQSWHITDSSCRWSTRTLPA